MDDEGDDAVAGGKRDGCVEDLAERVAHTEGPAEQSTEERLLITGVYGREQRAGIQDVPPSPLPPPHPSSRRTRVAPDI